MIFECVKITLNNMAKESKPIRSPQPARKQEKAEQGIWPTKTPLGYRNIIGPDGKKIIAVDTAVAPIVAKLFDWYASGGTLTR